MEFMVAQANVKQQSNQPRKLVYDEELDLPNTIMGSNSGNILFQIRSQGNFVLESILHEQVQSIQSASDLASLVVSDR